MSEGEDGHRPLKRRKMDSEGLQDVLAYVVIKSSLSVQLN